MFFRKRPPKFPSNNYFLSEEDKKNALISEEKYNELYMNRLLKKNKVCQEIVMKNAFESGEIFEETGKNLLRMTNFQILTKSALD